MSEEEEFSHQSSLSNNKFSTGDSDFLVTDSTSIRNPETDSSAAHQTEKNNLESFFTDQSFSLLKKQEKKESDSISINKSEKESGSEIETKSKSNEKEEIEQSYASNNSRELSSSRRSKRANLTYSSSNNKSQKQNSALLESSFNTSFDSNSTTTASSTIITTTTDINSKEDDQNIQNSDNDDKIIAASNLLLEKGTLPPFAIQGKVLQHLKSESLQAVLNCDYPKAATIDKAINKIVNETYRRRKGIRELRRERKVDNKVQKANYMMKKEEEECKTIYSDFLREEDEKLQKIKERQQEELRMLKEEWDKPETLLPFNKSSQKLLSMRRSQKVLALSKRYEEAEQLKKQADALQRKELKEAKEKAKCAYNQAYQTLVEQHNKELLCFNDHKQRLSTFLDLERKKAIRPFQNMAAFYERQQSARSLPNGKPAPKATHSSSTNCYAAKRATSMLDALPPTTPDVVAGVSKYKCMPETHPLGLTSIMKKNKKNTKRYHSVALNREPRRKQPPS